MSTEGNKKGKVAIISRESDSKTLDIEMLEAELNRRDRRTKAARSGRKKKAGRMIREGKTNENTCFKEQR